ncbi:unnamed protein product [Tilletia laevis]|uniref:Uncharacterized protein n=3 Tax=Tilletia TaxID=13289 RepID=A0A8X7SS82_9BASI|nr:hypothetical protein A4X06_0g9454 [Tilletia controversa]CAD6887913.1 unnamed protein product [Tilletia caries]CAD6965484.1 unnamed protein product [Tilletia laevis]CAD6896000.1 unnamed protein product [Tilletia controversa]CAD6908928.1 unnamed protein product [Tilletia caries]
MRSRLLVTAFMLATSFVSGTSNHVHQDTFPSESTADPPTAIKARDWADLAIAATGFATSLGFLGVTGQFYMKTYGKRSTDQEDERHRVFPLIFRLPQAPASLPEVSKRADPYPVILGGLCIVLSGSGLAATSIAHVKLLNVFGSKKTRRDMPDLDRRVDIDKISPDTLAKGLELLATSVSMLSIPLIFGNVMAIGRKPDNTTQH